MTFRCPWGESPPIYQDYHDREWGVPLHDDHQLFEFLTLETFQAGLSWLIVLRKRAAFRRAFSEFDPARVAEYGPDDVERLVNDASIIRNRAKIESAISNAQAFLAVQAELGSFDRYIWAFVNGEPIVNRYRRLEELPAKTPLAETISKDLRGRGFRFVGPTVTYAHMQATGMVNDHLVGCFRYEECKQLAQKGHAG